MIAEAVFLFVAGVLGGALNSAAGGGSFIIFPTLLFVGVPPVSANATNTLACCPGYMSGAYGFRKDLSGYKSVLWRYVLAGFAGGFLGAWLLLQTPPTVFEEAVPWLLLFASALFIFGTRLNAFFERISSRYAHASVLGLVAMAFLLLGICTYGGFFNAGLGIIVLAWMALAGFVGIGTMNGLKLLVSSSVSLAAIGLFILDGVIAWYESVFVIFGTLTGGYVAARIVHLLPEHYTKRFVIVVCAGITGWFFADVYFL